LKGESVRNDYKIGTMILGSVQTNCYYVYKESDTISDSSKGTEKTRPCIVIDPADGGSLIYERLLGMGLKVETILLTHAHFDHISGVRELKKLTNADVLISEKEKRLCMDTDANLSATLGHPVTITPDRWLCDGEEIETAGLSFKVLETPGHTEGSCCYYLEDAGVVFCGDTVFEGSIGRTDFPTGSMSVLVRSIHEKIAVLPDDTVLLPGHGGSTTVGDEKKYNQYFNMGL
jgi:glyoxylase-like metal-dependent hydrolase (beta-lactamase superfamily II)